MAHEVFISYSHNDKQIADAVCSALESNDVRCWIAPRDILPGMDWGSSIIDAIAGCRVMVLLLSSNSNASSQVKREVERATNKEITVIPFRIEDVSLSKSLEYHLSVTHWMDATTPPIEKHIQTLTEKIKQILSVDNGDAPVRKDIAFKTEQAPLRSAPFFVKRWKMMLGAALVVGLILFAGLVYIWDRPTANLNNFKISKDKEGTMESNVFSAGDTIYGYIEVLDNPGKVKLKFYLSAENVRGLTRYTPIDGSEGLLEVNGNSVAEFSIPVTETLAPGVYSLRAGILNSSGVMTSSSGGSVNIIGTKK